MTTQSWQWAKLTSEQLGLLTEAEQTLGTDYLLVYQPTESTDASQMGAQSGDLPVAGLNESQLECLRGLETRLDAVVIAYQKESD